jgi:hypothetical protein
MKKLLVYILLKDPLLVFILSLTINLFDVNPEGQDFQVNNIIGATLVAGLSLIIWDILLLSVPYYFLIRKERLPQNQLFTAGVLLHIPILLITYIEKFDLTAWPAIILAMMSSGAAGMIYQLLTVRKCQLLTGFRDR